jgi:hypothetical protein
VLGYREWNQRLAEHFFSAVHANKPVYLSLDDDILGEFTVDAEGSDSAADSLASAVRSTLGSGDVPFVDHLVQRTQWRKDGMNGPPPYIALLALCVLAASRMARDAESGIETTAFYPQLNPLLNRPQFGGMPRGFEQVDDLWTDLARWLDNDLGGARGKSTAATHRFFKHIGWPISQCLLREADRRRLTEFFRAVGLEPHAEIESSPLWTLFLNWARAGSRLSDQGLRVIRNARTEVADQIAEIIKREFDVWEGELLDSHGRRRGGIALVLEISQGGRRIAAKLVPRKPDGFPEQARWRLEGGEEIEISASGDEWYEPLQAEPSRAILTSGIDMNSNGFALAYEPSPVVPLRASLGVGAWASVRQATAIEEHCVVTTEALLPRVREFLMRYAETGWRVLDRAGNLPGGWRVLERVSITKPVPEVSDELRRLAPRLHTATKFEGGLQVAPRQYLTGGEPDLWITVERGESVEIDLDERKIAVSENVLEVELASLDPPLPPGDHEIFAGGIRRHFSTFEGFPIATPASASSLGHVMERHGTYLPSSVDAEPLPANGPRSMEVYICGASTKGRVEDLPEPVQPPILVPFGFRTYAVLGAEPGEVLSLLPPKHPWWLRDAGLYGQCQFFDQPVPFEAQWLVLNGRLGLQVRPLRLPPADPVGGPLPSGARVEGLAAAWFETISGAGKVGVRPRVYPEIWDKYVAAAS